jgi:hypothetical protein
MYMLTLNDSRWNNWQDAYGSASRIPLLLQQVISDKSQRHDPQSGPWFELWSRLYHQGTIYTASYAAVPVIAAAIDDAMGIVPMDFFLLPACIELARHDSNAPAMPADINVEYNSALKRLGDSARRYTGEISDPYLRKAATAVQLISEGKLDEARELIDV